MVLEQGEEFLGLCVARRDHLVGDVWIETKSLGLIETMLADRPGANVGRHGLAPFSKRISGDPAL